MRAALAAPVVALQFLTIIPVPTPRRPPDGAFPGAVALFPLMGAAIGGAVAGADALAGIALPAAIGAALDLVLLAILTGGLHLDGLADAADGLLGNLPRERRLEVMRDGGIGAFGAATLILVLLIEYASLVTLRPTVRPTAIVAAAALSRWAMALLLWAFPYARAAGAGSAFRTGLGRRHVVTATLLAALAVGLLLSSTGALVLAVGAATALLVGRFAVARVGGCTGDVYGAGGELAFAVGLVTMAGLAR